jgi:tRNA 2-thiouridine synthesizing protein E
MSELQVGGVTVSLDEDGFLEDAADWNEEIAVKLAETEDVPELTEEHWAVINYLREYFAEFQVAPMVRKLLKDTGKSQGEIYELFPSGPAKGACKIAGLPKPTGCV